MPSYAVTPTTNITGHNFKVNNIGCGLGGCHTSGVPDTEGYITNTKNNIGRLVDLLTQWATNKGPAILGATDYNRSKQNSWEFPTIGTLAPTALPGPVATNQVKLPEEIRQARFNVYMVKYDGSYGVHNPRYSSFLIRDAETKVLKHFNVAKFTANNASALVGSPVFFTNLNPAVTASGWSFGDGNTSSSTATVVSNTYAAAGTYTVTLTATDATGTETLVRTNYVIVYNRPVPSFTASPPTGAAPLTVTFANTSANAIYYRWTFNTTNSALFSNEENPSFTYTNAGTYNVALRAYNEAGSVTITNTITVTP